MNSSKVGSTYFSEEPSESFMSTPIHFHNSSARTSTTLYLGLAHLAVEPLEHLTRVGRFLE